MTGRAIAIGTIIATTEIGGATDTSDGIADIDTGIHTIGIIDACAR